MRYLLHPNTKILGCIAAEQHLKGQRPNQVPQFEDGTGCPIVNFTVVTMDIGNRGPETAEVKVRVAHNEVPTIPEGEIVDIHIGGEIVGRPWDMGDNAGVTWTADTVALGAKPSAARPPAPEQAANGKRN